MKRGFNQKEAMVYVGAKRRVWEALWAPRLIPIHQGVCLVFDRQDLDQLFEDFKNKACEAATQFANSEDIHANITSVWSESRGMRVDSKKEKTKWVKKCEESTSTEKPAHGKLISGGKGQDFDSVAFSILQKPKVG